MNKDVFKLISFKLRTPKRRMPSKACCPVAVAPTTTEMALYRSPDLGHTALGFVSFVFRILLVMR
jgi:hypothetical protein